MVLTQGFEWDKCTYTAIDKDKVVINTLQGKPGDGEKKCGLILRLKAEGGLHNVEPMVLPFGHTYIFDDNDTYPGVNGYHLKAYELQRH